MSEELSVYQKSPTAWVYMLAFKYLPQPRFKEVLDLMATVATEDEKELARRAWVDFK